MNQTLENINNLDKIAFEQLFRDYFKPLTLFTKKYVGDLDDAKEIVHEVFLNLWAKRENIDVTKAVKSYLYTSAYNRSLNHLRDSKKFDKNAELEYNSDNESVWNFSDHLDTAGLEKKINNTIDSLSEKCREVFILSRHEGLKYNEIAEKLNISVKTVESQMSKALSVLRENLKEYMALLILWMIGNN